MNNVVTGHSQALNAFIHLHLLLESAWLDLPCVIQLICVSRRSSFTPEYFTANVTSLLPFAEKYNLHPGVFLFLGFSNQDESVLKEHTGLDSVNVIDELRKLIDPYFQHQFVNPADKDNSLNVFKMLNTVSTLNEDWLS